MSGLTLRAAFPGDLPASPPAQTTLRKSVSSDRRPLVRFRRGPVTTAVVVCTMLCTLIARPAYADPSGDIPDTGSRPIASGQLVLPGPRGAAAAPPAATTTQRGPKAAELAQLELAVAQL